MKWFKDGDRVAVTRDDFVDLQESPAVFISEVSPAGQIIQHRGIASLPLSDLAEIHNQLDVGDVRGHVVTIGESTCYNCGGSNISEVGPFDGEINEYHCDDCGIGLVPATFYGGK